MDSLFLKIADFVIKINFQKHKLMDQNFESIRQKLIEDIKLYSRNFITTKTSRKVDFTIDISLFNPETLKRKNNYYLTLYKKTGKDRIATSYLISVFEFQWLLQGVFHQLFSKNNTIVLHASGCAIDGKAYVFVGRAGAGKSTIIDLLKSKYPAIGDDSIITRIDGTRINCYQTPLIERSWWIDKSSLNYPLAKIFFLKKANFNKIEKIENKEYVTNKVLKQSWILKNYDKKAFGTILKLINNFDEFYFLYFTKDSKKLINFFKRNLGEEGLRPISNHKRSKELNN